MKYFSAILLILILLNPVSVGGQERKRIVEKVAVNWWQVPIYAMDASGQAVADLKADEIRLTMNGKAVTSFAFIKHEWAGRSGSGTKESDEISLRVEPSPGIPHAKPVIFLLFDLALTGRQSVKRAKAVAKEIINKSEAGTKFVIMTIEPFAGLTFISHADKPGLLEAVNKNVISKNNWRVVPGVGESNTLEVPDREARFLKMQAARFYRRKCTVFFRAFQALFFHLNGIAESKVVYLFSEGVSASVLSSLRGGATEYNAHMKRITNYLNQCGAVLFLINTMGVEQYASDITSRQTEGGDIGSDSGRSGDWSLHYMAEESGGKYLRGTKAAVINKLDNIHRAFYELAFPGTGAAAPAEIAVSCTRKGVSITTIRVLEKGKAYKKMSKIGKEVLAGNLVLGNPLVEGRFSYSKAVIRETTFKDNLVTYYVMLPKGFVNKQLDLFKVRLGRVGGEAVIKKIKRSRVLQKSTILTVSFYLNEGEDKGDTCFVLAEPSTGKFLLYRAGLDKT